MIKNLKFKTISIIDEKTEWDDSRNYSDDEDYIDWNSSNYRNKDVDSSDSDSSEEDHLCYLIRTMFTNYGITAQVDRDELDIAVYIILDKREKMKNILKSFDVVYKLKKDILPQYESEMELYESKEGLPILSFQFYNEKSDNLPF